MLFAFHVLNCQNVLCLKRKSFAVIGYEQFAGESIIYRKLSQKSSGDHIMIDPFEMCGDNYGIRSVIMKLLNVLFVHNQPVKSFDFVAAGICYNNFGVE